MKDNGDTDNSPTSEDKRMTNENNKNNKEFETEDFPNEATVKWTDIMVCGLCGRRSMVTTEAPVNYRFDMTSNTVEQHIWFKLERKDIKPRAQHCLYCEDSPVGRYDREDDQ